MIFLFFFFFIWKRSRKFGARKLFFEVMVPVYEPRVLVAVSCLGELLRASVARSNTFINNSVRLFSLLSVPIPSVLTIFFRCFLVFFPSRLQKGCYSQEDKKGLGVLVFFLYIGPLDYKKSSALTEPAA